MVKPSCLVPLANPAHLMFVAVVAMWCFSDSRAEVIHPQHSF